MKPSTFIKGIAVSIAVAALIVCPGFAQAQQPVLAERVVALKASLEANRAHLKTYEWIETTVISVNGEDRASKEERCYYDAEGGIERVELDQTAAAGPRFGLRKRIAERKKEEMTDFMKSAVALTRSYLPPSTAKIQTCKDAGNASIDVLDPGKRVRLTFKNYEKAGDSLSVEVDLSKNHLLGITVNSYVDDPSQKVELNVRMSQLDDGTTYPADSILTVPSKNLKVEMENSGYRKMN